MRTRRSLDARSHDFSKVVRVDVVATSHQHDVFDVLAVELWIELPLKTRAAVEHIDDVDWIIDATSVSAPNWDGTPTYPTK